MRSCISMCALVMSALLTISCSDDTEQQQLDSWPVADAGADSASDQGLPDQGAPDAACHNFAGTYGMPGSKCTNTSAYFAQFCVWQPSGCDATVYTTLPGRVFSGTAVGGKLEVTDTAKTMTCTITAKGATMEIACKDSAASVACSGTATRLQYTGASATCCDTAKQNCPSGERCVLKGVTVQSMMFMTGACVQDNGTKAVGEECTFSGSVDNCKGSGHCTTWDAETAGKYHCRTLCTDGSQCGPKEGCREINGSFPPTPRSGVCVTKCDPLGQVTECPSNNVCHLAYDISWDSLGVTQLQGFCVRGAGYSKAGVACTHNGDRDQGLDCQTDSSGSKVCVPYCKLSSPSCPTGKVCTKFAHWQPLASLDVGFCF